MNLETIKKVAQAVIEVIAIFQDGGNKEQEQQQKQRKRRN